MHTVRHERHPDETISTDSMEQRTLGHGGLEVPVIGMGTWKTFDVRGARDVSARCGVVDVAIAAGTTLFDTSPMYGQAEQVLASAIDGRRDHVVVADKIWTSSRREAREQVRRALEWYSGVVDIYQIHNLVAWREHLPMLEDLRDTGQARAIGVTHYDHSALGSLMMVMETRRIQMVQIPYSVADRAVERDLLPLAEQLGIGVLVMEPLGTGRLVRRGPPAPDLARLERFGVRTWAQALLKWIVSDTRVHSALPATSSVTHAAENAAAGDPPWFDAETRAYVAHVANRM
jgi:aryl-alcohol dehydrogenase-like predicted oxidoreductase